MDREFFSYFNWCSAFRALSNWIARNLGDIIAQPTHNSMRKRAFNKFYFPTTKPYHKFRNIISFKWNKSEEARGGKQGKILLFLIRMTACRKIQEIWIMARRREAQIKRFIPSCSLFERVIWGLCQHFRANVRVRPRGLCHVHGDGNFEEKTKILRVIWDFIWE